MISCKEHRARKKFAQHIENVCKLTETQPRPLLITANFLIQKSHCSRSTKCCFYFHKKHFAAERDEIKLKLANTKSDENDEQKKFMVTGNKNKKLFAIKTSFSSSGRHHAIVHEAICRYFFVSLGIVLPCGAFMTFYSAQVRSASSPAPGPFHTRNTHSLTRACQKTSAQQSARVYLCFYLRREIPKCIVTQCLTVLTNCMCFWSHKTLQK